jgi:coiled-coil domain-containing protein 55
MNSLKYTQIVQQTKREMSKITYGLAIRKKPTQSTTTNETDNVFGEESDSDDENVTQQKQTGKRCNQQQQKRSSKSMINLSKNANNASNLIAMKMQQQALQQDENVYKYDELYDDMQQDKKQREQSILQKKIDESKESKYIGQLVKAAEQRKREQERTRDRKIAKELQKEKEQFGESEVFVTSAYKKKLQEDKIWEEEEKKRKEAEEKNSVTRHGMTNFYRNILSGTNSSSDSAQKEQNTSTEQSYSSNKHHQQQSERSHSNEHRSIERSPTPPRDNRQSLKRPLEEEASTNVPTSSNIEQPAKVVKLTSQDTIQSARERYLQRMAQRKNQEQ